MTQECPSDNMICVLTVLAEVQACIDQLAGTAQSVLGQDPPAAERFMLEHQLKVARFLQKTLDKYGEQHSNPPVDFALKAAQKLRHDLVL